MVYFQVKSEERRAAEDYVAQVFGADLRKKESFEAVECIAARTAEAERELKRREEKRNL